MGFGMYEDPALKELLEEVRSLLDQHYNLVHDSTIINEKDKQEHERRNAEAKVAFEKRQTKVTFVGAMKAGKSTCINASTGVPVLPSRTFPMTSLSTTISHNPFIKVPEMLIPEHALQAINATMAKLRPLQEDDSLPEHVQKFVRDLVEIDFAIGERVVGIHKIDSTLYLLNDLVRTCADIEVKSRVGDTLVDNLLESFEGLSSFPQIETSFYTTTYMTAGQGNGILTLIDTPGPDEIRLSDALQRINRIILSDSDAICIVLNAKALGNTAEAALLKMVLPFVSGSRIYVIVNQVDDEQNRESSVSQFKKNLLEFNASNAHGDILTVPDDHIFPLSALHATYAMMFIKYKQDNPNTEELPAPTDNWRNFYQVVWGTRWERTMAKSDLKDLEEDCAELLAKSGMESFLTKVVHEALTKASHRSIEGVMNNLRQSSRLLKKRVNNQVSLFEHKMDLETIVTIRDRLHHAKNKMSYLQDQGRYMQATALRELVQAWSNDCREMTKCLEDHIEGIPTSWRIPYYHPKPQKYFGEKKITGKSKEEVMNQVQPALDELKGRIIDVLRGTLQNFVNVTYSQKLIELSDKFNKEIVAQARAEISAFKPFHIHFAFPKQFDMPTKDLKMQLGNTALPNSRVTTTKHVKRAWWWFFNLVTWEETTRKTIFELDPASLRSKILSELYHTCGDLDTSISEKMEATIKTLFDPFFVSAQDAIDSVSADLDAAQKRLTESQLQIEDFKGNAKVLLEELTSIEQATTKVQKSVAALGSIQN